MSPHPLALYVIVLHRSKSAPPTSSVNVVMRWTQKGDRHIGKEKYDTLNRGTYVTNARMQIDIYNSVRTSLIDNNEIRHLFTMKQHA